MVKVGCTSHSSPLRRLRGLLLVTDGGRASADGRVQLGSRGMIFDTLKGDAVRVSSHSLQQFRGVLTRLHIHTPS